jgi:putative RNA 2'-phosphotransferase
MSDYKDYSKISKFLSLLLRHSPDTIHLTMDENGWVSIQQLIDNALKYKNMNLDIETIKDVVATSDKQRFIIDVTGKRIRANQGHSISVDLELKNVTPPDTLYHGTSDRFLETILKDGLKPMSRQHVHLSATKETAVIVGKRHGKPIVLQIDCKSMNEAVIKFYLSENNVWLVDYVHPKFISIADR